jgi:hypothetical protein
MSITSLVLLWTVSSIFAAGLNLNCPMSDPNSRPQPHPIPDGISKQLLATREKLSTSMCVRGTCFVTLAPRMSSSFFLYLTADTIAQVLLFAELRVYVVAGTVAQWYFQPPGSNSTKVSNKPSTPA